VLSLLRVYHNSCSQLAITAALSVGSLRKFDDVSASRSILLSLSLYQMQTLHPAVNRQCSNYINILPLITPAYICRLYIPYCIVYVT